MTTLKNKPTFLTTPRFSELSIETSDKLYTVRCYLDGNAEYLVNLSPVLNMPKTPYTKILLNTYHGIVNKLMRLYSLPFDGQEYRQLWHEIKDEVEA